MHLWLIRHAKSDWTTAARRDFDRPLNRRGERDGPRMARWLSSQQYPASWVWTSDAVRALATAEFVMSGFRAAAPTLAAEHRLYDAAPEQLLTVIQETPADQQSVAVVAHNPGLTYLVNLLCGEQITENLPTFGIARMQVDTPWSGLAFGTAHLDLLTSPKRIDPTSAAGE